MQFKHILWVEDKAGLDSKGSSLIQIPGFNKEAIALERHFKDYANEVEICPTFTQAVELICTYKIYQYDCIILDLDLTSGNDKEIPYSLLNEHGIDVEELGESELLENGGYYIYLLLLNRAFPIYRILVLSAHGGGTVQIALTNKFKEAGIRSPQRIGDDKNIDLTPILDEMFDFNNKPYYNIRLFIFYVCKYCQEFINDKNFNIDKMAYNHYVYGEDKKLDIEAFSALLDNIKLQLPLINILDSKEISRRYKNILRYLTEVFHANFDNRYRSDINQMMCWKLVTLIRNWMAHGKLNEDKLNHINFLILFTICIRTIFGRMKLDNDDNEGIHIEQWQENVFEKDIFNFLSNVLDSKNAKSTTSTEKFTTEYVIKQFIEIYNYFPKLVSKESVLSTSYITMLEKVGGRGIHNFQGKFDMFLKAICFYPAEKTRITIGAPTEESNKEIIAVRLYWKIPENIKEEMLGKKGDSNFIHELRKICVLYLINELRTS